MPNRPYSSMSEGYGGGHDPLAHDPLGMDNSQSYLGVEGGSGMGMGSVLRDTAISGYDNDDSNRARFLSSLTSPCKCRRPGEYFSSDEQ